MLNDKQNTPHSSGRVKEIGRTIVARAPTSIERMRKSERVSAAILARTHAIASRAMCRLCCVAVCKCMRYRVRIPCITLSVRGMVTLIHSKPLEPFVSWKSPAGNQSVVCTSVRARVCVVRLFLPLYGLRGGKVPVINQWKRDPLSLSRSLSENRTHAFS